MSSDAQNANPVQDNSGKLSPAGSHVPDGHSVTKRLQSELMQLMVSLYLVCQRTDLLNELALDEPNKNVV
jgi:hypothetical protein